MCLGRFSIQNGAVASWKFLFHIGERKGPFLYSSGRFFFHARRAVPACAFEESRGNFQNKGNQHFFLGRS